MMFSPMNEVYLRAVFTPLIGSSAAMDAHRRVDAPLTLRTRLALPRRFGEEYHQLLW